MSNRKKVLNTADRTIIISRGFRTDQRTPSMLRRYFSLKSFETNEERINQLRCRADFWFVATQGPPPVYKFAAETKTAPSSRLTIPFYRTGVIGASVKVRLHMKCRFVECVKSAKMDILQHWNGLHSGHRDFIPSWLNQHKSCSTKFSLCRRKHSSNLAAFVFVRGKADLVHS